MRLLKELMRVATQHRAFYCYVLLSVWIFLLIAGKWKSSGLMAIVGKHSIYTQYKSKKRFLKLTQLVNMVVNTRIGRALLYS